MVDYKPAETPMILNQKFNHDTDLEDVEPTQYRQMVGNLIYLIVTHPDISYSIGVASQFIKNPNFIIGTIH